MNDPHDPYQWPGFIPEFHKPFDQRIKQEVPCMTIPPASKPPEGTPTPSTVSLPSYQEWYDFFLQTLQHVSDPRIRADFRAEALTRATCKFLAQRGSPP